MPITITPAIVHAATCPPDRAQAETFDSLIQGLALRVGRTGAKSWTLLLRENGRRVRVTLGSAALMSVAEARTAARSRLTATSPRAQPRNHEHSFEALTTIFFERHRLRPRTEDGYRRMLDHEIGRHWRGRLIATLTKDDVFRVLDPILKRGARVHANRVHRLMINILNLAVDRGWIEVNVAQRIRQPGGRERSRDRVLPVSDLARLWLALGRERDVVRDVIRFVILTAARKGEAVGARFNEFDFAAATWTIPAARSKNHRERTVPLSDSALKIIESRQPRLEGFQIVRMMSDAKAFGVMPTLSPVMKRLCEERGIEHATVHDLRRSSATAMATAGVARHVLKAILGHVDRDVTAVYDRSSYSAEKVEAVKKLDAMITEAVAQITPQPPATRPLIQPRG